jgi:putative ABC transport system permease protein
LVSATIISSSLGLGDTVSAVNVHFVYIAYGYTDEALVNERPSGYAPFPVTAYTQLSSALSTDSNIKGLTPEIVTSTSIYDNTTGVPQSGLNLIGVNASATSVLGSFVALNGSTVVGPQPGEVILDQTAASDVNASAGDRVTIFGNQTESTVIVQAVVQEDTRGGFLYGGNVFLPLATTQALLTRPGQLNFIAVTNVGSLTDAAALSGTVMTTLNTTLATLNHPYGIQAQAILQNSLNAAISSGTSFATLTLVLGLFSILAGAMLIVGIFVMLAEERKGEMGMLRAVGLRRRELVYTWYFEGLAYSAGSALAGTFLGIVVAYALIYSYGHFFGLSGLGPSAVLASFTVTTQSLIIAYVAGFLLTLVTVTAASSRVSRLNIVRAIRDIPEPAPTVRTYTSLAYIGIVVAAIGAFVLVVTAHGTGDVSYPVVGGALVILGLALFASRFVKNRYCFSAAGIALIVWGGVPPIRDLVIGTGHSGSIFVLFIDGILMVLGAVLIYAFNQDLIVHAFSRVSTRRPSTVSVIRVGMSYPSRRGFRTAINVSIFALVLFTVVAVASFGASLEQDLNGLVQAESGGYTFIGASDQPIPNLPAEIASNATLASSFSATVPLYTGDVHVTIPSSPNGSFNYPAYAAPTNVSPEANFYTTNGFNFSSTVNGSSTQATWNRLATDPNALVVDATFTNPSAGGVGFGGAGASVVKVGSVVDLTDLKTGKSASLTLIGVMAQFVINGVWMNPATALSMGITGQSTFFLTVAPGVSVDHAGQQLKVAFLPYGLTLFNFQQLISQSIDSTVAIVSLLEIFVALGLAVGIAAMGIVALRAVVERRSEIGMLRALGFTQGMTLRAFLLEFSYIAVFGIIVGTALAVLLLYNATVSAGSTGLFSFVIPWLNVALVIVVAYLLVVLAVIGPSRRAARLPPADAIRYSE